MFLVEDLAGPPSPKALKIVAVRGEPMRLAHLRHEFQILRQLQHPGLVRVFDFGETREGALWFTSEFVAGADLYSASAGWSVPEIEIAMAALAGTLQFLHERKVLHNDLKPSNVIVPLGPASVRLLDFGLASSTRAALHGGGTPPYMAPERLRRPPQDSVAGDLYSFGAVFYRCATRRLPFDTDEPDKLLSRIALGAVPARAFRPDLPVRLETLLLRLLDPDPGKRPSSATEVVAELGSLHPSKRDPDSKPSESLLPGAPLLERESILADLRAAWTKARSGTPERVLLVGEAGMGKSRLLEELRHELELGGERVIQGRGEQGSPQPWALVTQLLRGLSALSDAPVVPAGLRSLLFPGTDTDVPVEVRHDFARLVADCAGASPLAILVDDMPWVDPESRALLDDLADPKGSRLPIMLCAAARDEPAAAETIDRCRSAGWTMLSIPPLSIEAQRSALGAIFAGGAVAGDLVDDALAQAAGNPLALSEIARSWVESGAVTRSSGRWTAVPGAPKPAGGRPLELIAARLRRVPAELVEVLELVALHGRPIDRAALEAATSGSPGAVTGLRRAGLAIETADGVDVRHPLVRQAVLDLLEGKDLRPLHRRLADGLSAVAAPPADMWAHRLLGGDLETGVKLALSVGVRAEEMEDFPTGRVILEQALAAVEGAPSAVTAPDIVRLRVSLATCLAVTGSAVEAIDMLLRTAEKSEGEAKEQLLTRAARLLEYTGDLKVAAEVFRRLDPPPRSPRLRVEWAGASMRYHEFLGDSSGARAAIRDALAVAESLERDPHAVGTLCDFYSRAAFTESDQEGPLAGDPYLEKAIRVAERHGIRGRSLFARHRRAVCLAEAGRLAEALAEYQALDPEVAVAGNATARTAMRRHEARTRHYRGDSAEAVRLLREISSHGNPMSRRNTREMLAEVLADAGDPAAMACALESAREFVASGSRGSYIEMALGGGLRAGLWLGSPDVGAELEQALRVNQPRVVPCDRPDQEAAWGYAALLRGDSDAAIRHLEEAAALAARLQPIEQPRCLFHLAYALARAARKDEASAVAGAAEEGYRRMGNEIERARTAALSAAIAQDRILGGRPVADWVARARPAAGGGGAREPSQRLADAVASATGATAVWIGARDPERPQIVARAGPCAAAEPFAWSDGMRVALVERRQIDRPGVGLVLPVSVEGEPAALVVEDRTFPQAFSPEAAAVATSAGAWVLADLARRQLESDLASARTALQRGQASSAPDVTVATVSPGRRAHSRAGVDPRLIELTLGPLQMRHRFDEIVGRSHPMRKALETLDRVVDLDANVLVIGETGTGKELVARALHEKGPRAPGPFVAVNCSAIPAALAESEFFGHHPGAFTGAAKTRHRGLFEQASGGTLFLDEIGELDPQLQAKLLRALEEGEIRPLGGERPVKVDVRIVSATNFDLREASAAGRFRSDLYFRLAVVDVRLPPLRERPEDIPSIVKHLLPLIAEAPLTVAPAALDALAAYSWPGNVRELRNELERAAAFAGDGRIEPPHLSPAVRRALDQGQPRSTTLSAAVASLERRMIAEALKEFGNNRTHAAKKLGITRVGLYHKIKKLGLKARRDERTPR